MKHKSKRVRDKQRLPPEPGTRAGECAQQLVAVVMRIMEEVHTDSASTEYRAVPELAGYRVNTRGRVQSCWGFGGTYMTSEWHTLQPFLADGRRYVRLGKDGRRNDYLVGSLVLRTWIGEPPPDGRFVWHINNQVDDDRLDNLKWSKHKQYRRRPAT
jgi:hypothetical protein